MTRLLIGLVLGTLSMVMGALNIYWSVKGFQLRRENKRLERRLADIQPSIIHAAGNPCPPGYHLVRDVFTESDGSKQDAWIRDAPGAFSVDVLMPGESIQMDFFLTPNEKEGNTV